MRAKAFLLMLVLAAFIIAWFLWRTHVRAPSITATQLDDQQTNLRPSDISQNSVQDENGSDSNTERTVRPTANQALSSKPFGFPPPGASEQERAAFLQSLGLHGEKTQDVRKPLRFFGRVLDESDVPVSGVRISFDWNEPPPAQPEKVGAITDVNGNFATDVVTGRFLRLSLEKEGYYVSQSNRLDFQFPPNADPGEPGNPFLFHLRKRGPGADLITSTSGVRDYVALKAPKDGTPVRLDFFNRKVGNEGQLQISNFKPADGRQRTDWSITISIPDGGLIEEHDEFPFEAPAGPYQSVLEFRFDKNSLSWVQGFKKDFYVTFGVPPKYGRVHVETDTFTSGAHVEYAINPDGSRYLEPK